MLSIAKQSLLKSTFGLICVLCLHKEETLMISVIIMEIVDVGTFTLEEEEHYRQRQCMYV